MGFPMNKFEVSSILVIVQLLSMIESVDGIPIDNGVVATSVQCTSEMIAVNFTTRNPFGGRIFVKGLSDRAECLRSYADGGPTSSMPFIGFSFGACNMIRSRMMSPQPGMMQTIVVIISFHKTFITKVDKAYKIQCFYTEAEMIVTSGLEVSMLSTELARDTQALPSCTYEVRRGSRTGDVVRYANVGDSVFHEWECKSDEVGMLVKNCLVDDGQGNKQMIVDEKGCAVDHYILADLTYDMSGNAKAWVESHVFKYADKASLFFQCTIQLCMMGDSLCNNLSPPSCQQASTKSTKRVNGNSDKRRRTKRSNLTDISQMMEIDLMTDPISVLDLDPDAVENKRPGLESSMQGVENRGLLPSESAVDVMRKELAKSRPMCIPQANAVCMSSTNFVFMIAAIICLLMSTFLTATYIHLRRYPNLLKKV